jgi:hypothetical protein
VSITNSDGAILREAGFTLREIRELAESVDPKGNPQPPININSPAWQAALKNRTAWINRARRDFQAVHKTPLTRARFDQIVDQWYRKNKGSPWDWLKITYQPRKKMDFLTAAKARIVRRQSDLRRTGLRIVGGNT